MKVGLIGFGKTGKAVATVILANRDISLEWVVRSSTVLSHRSAPEFLGVVSDEPGVIYSTVNTQIEELLDLHPVDIIIDFSSKSGLDFYGRSAGRRGVKIISAISHYSEHERQLLRELSLETSVFWSPNITLGVNFLLFASKFLKKIAPFVDIEIVEEHFKGKEGVSGTALKIAESLDIEKSGINSIRAGGIVGKHEIIFGFPFQTVRLIHESISREAFGSGVIFVAENLIKKEKGMYEFQDILEPYFDRA